MTNHDPRKAFRLRLRLQVSLRLLLLLVTAFAIGLSLWYRWPYEERERIYPIDPRTGQPDKLLPPNQEVVTTWRNEWGGTRKRHGPVVWRSLATNREDITVEHYRAGRLHGKYIEKHDGNSVAGQYDGGRKSGTWRRDITSLHGAQIKTTENWQNDKPHGEWTMLEPSGGTLRLTFDNSTLTQVNGHSIADVRDRLSQSAGFSRLEEKLLSRVPFDEFYECPLADLIDFIADDLECEIVVGDRKSAGVPITWVWDDHTLETFLLSVTEQSGLSLEIRYGCLWIAQLEPPGVWRDTTSVESVQPPQGSQLAELWGKKVGVVTERESLSSVVQGFGPDVGEVIDVSQIAPTVYRPIRYPVTMVTRAMPLRAALGVLLSETGCRCKQEGQRVILLPPEDDFSLPDPGSDDFR